MYRDNRHASSPYNLTSKNKGYVAPLSDSANIDDNSAANLVRQKITQIYAEEPSAKAEIKEIEDADFSIKPKSKHQQFMLKLSSSGRSLAEIQTAWHNYYLELPDNEKHEVWQEFYSNNSKKPAITSQTPETEVSKHLKQPRPRSVSEIKQHLAKTINGGGQLKRKHHVQSLAFGLVSGGLVVLVLLFGFFNERFIAPFVTPSKNVSSTPIIIDPNNTAATSLDPKVIIPKINVEVPVVFDTKSVDEKAIQKDLEKGVVRYANSPLPGQKGNIAIVGHSSNNILNSGRYKFAFVLLSRLDVGDTFILNYEGKRFVYRIYDKKIVKPTELGVLGNADKPSTATLITCDPPGTSLNRLVVVGEQISPDPIKNVAVNSSTNKKAPAVLPGNAPSLWQRIKEWLTS